VTGEGRQVPFSLRSQRSAVGLQVRQETRSGRNPYRRARWIGRT